MRLGKDKHAIALVVFLFFSLFAGGQTGKSYKYQTDGGLPGNDVFVSDQSITINYSVSEVNIESITNDNGSFFRVSIPGHISTSESGKPELPVLSRLISVPEGSVCNVRISDVRTSRIKPESKKIEGLLLPAQESESKSLQQRKPEFKIDKELYASRRIIPSDTVRIESVGTVRGKNLSTLYILPVRYNPRANVLEVITSMKIEITFSSPENIRSKSLSPESSLFEQQLSKSVLNYNPEEVVPGFSDQPVRMIIMTDTAFRKELEPFIRWKTQKGFKVQTLYRGTGLAGNTYAQLQDTLAKIYKASSETVPPPEYLLIIGDITKVPSHGSSSNYSDMYYGEFDGNGDYIPEMYVGRLPVADTAELKSVVSKLIQYEKFEYADTNKFYYNAIGASGLDAGNATYMNGQIKYLVSNYLTSSFNINAKPFYYYSNLDKALAARKDSIINLINKGTSFINYTGHGDAVSWLHLDFKMDTAKFKNKNMYPLVISNACLTGRFYNKESLGTKMFTSSDKGAIGFIGCSQDSYWNEDYYWAVGLGSISGNPTYEGTGLGAFDRLFHTHSEPASDWYYTMGQIVFAGNLAVLSSTSSYRKYYWEYYNLIGDPSVVPIIGKPDTFNISIPDTLPNGIKSITLDIPPFAYAAVSHFDTLWDASFASASGSLLLEMPGLSDDSCLIVITGQNKIPIIKTIYFSDIADEFINLSSASVNDSLGNGNGFADYGETCFLKLEVSNLGLSDANGLYAKISSTSEWITTSLDSVFIGTLTARSVIVLSDKLELIISPNVPDKEIIIINLTLKDEKSEKNYTIDISAHAPRLQIINCIVDRNGDYIADPGETFDLVFKVLNSGSSDISGQFTIDTTQNNGLKVMGPNVKNGIFKSGEITEITMTVELSKEVSSGSYISLLSTLDCNPYVLNKNFSFSVGRIRESFESESFNIFPWINISPIPWIFTGTNSYEGSISARSGAIPNNGTSSLMIKVSNQYADSVKFFYKVSSEASYDFFLFKLNGTEVLKKSGEVEWTKKVVPVPAGLNKLEWIYKKDGSTERGLDCAWVDLIDFTTMGSVNYIQKDLQVARIVTPIQKDQYRFGTLTVKVLNVGKDTLKGFNLAYSINEHSPVRQFFQNKLYPFSDSVAVSFTSKADLSRLGIYNIVVYGFDNYDDYILNDTVRINFENDEIIDSLRIFPNPFADQFTIFINSKYSDILEISLSNISGVKFYSTQKNIISGKNEIIISDIGLRPSLYYLNIRGKTINKTVPVLKIK